MLYEKGPPEDLGARRASSFLARPELLVAGVTSLPPRASAGNDAAALGRGTLDSIFSLQSDVVLSWDRSEVEHMERSLETDHWSRLLEKMSIFGLRFSSDSVVSMVFDRLAQMVALRPFCGLLDASFPLLRQSVEVPGKAAAALLALKSLVCLTLRCARNVACGLPSRRQRRRPRWNALAMGPAEWHFVAALLRLYDAMKSVVTGVAAFHLITATAGDVFSVSSVELNVFRWLFQMEEESDDGEGCRE